MGDYQQHHAYPSGNHGCSSVMGSDHWGNATIVLHRRTEIKRLLAMHTQAGSKMDCIAPATFAHTPIHPPLLRQGRKWIALRLRLLHTH
jgi:hypothetical protein